MLLPGTSDARRDMENTNAIAFKQFRICIVQPVLGELSLPGGEAAIRLLLGTAAQESALLRYRQYPTGSGNGFYQIEAGTHDDLFTNFLNARPALRDSVLRFAVPNRDRVQQLQTNLAYATAIARLIYWRAPDPLPSPDDIDGLGKYYKQHFNTATGAATVGEFVSNYRRLIGGQS